MGNSPSRIRFSEMYSSCAMQGTFLPDGTAVTLRDAKNAKFFFLTGHGTNFAKGVFYCRFFHQTVR